MTARFDTRSQRATRQHSARFGGSNGAPNASRVLPSQCAAMCVCAPARRARRVQRRGAHVAGAHAPASLPFGTLGQ